MTHEMVKRVATAIAEPKQRYVVKCKQNDYGEVAQWQLWFIDGDKENWVNSFGKYDCDHTKAEYTCEQMNNELLARLAIEAMKKLSDDIVKFMIESYGFHQNEFWAGIWEGTINTILKE